MLKANMASVLEKIANSKKSQQLLLTRTEKKLALARQALLREFNESLITKEIEAGPISDNFSKTLPGLTHGGNLFSFIGFHAGDEPIAVLREILMSNRYYRLNKNPGKKIIKHNNSIQITYKITYPDIEQIIEEMGEDGEYPDQWRDGSWVTGISQGIFGLSYYLYDEEFDTYEQSRSGVALQAKRAGKLVVIRNNSQSKPTKYLQSFLRNFVINLKKKTTK